MTYDRRTARRLVWVSVFAIAFGYVEASVVVYLRALYYPEGFTFPLKLMSERTVVTEMVREVATIVMLVSVSVLSGRNRWQRVGYFMVAFGVWDVLFYVWLSVVIGWPARLTDWDTLFLLPVPWIGPVLAPVLISLLAIVGGTLLALRTAEGVAFHPGILSWILALVGVGILLTSFVADTGATLRGAMPQPYRYDLLAAGLALCTGGCVMAFRHKPRGSS